ncbi:MAG: 4Fe-4S cluster-binding domain-containing protein [Vicinamibacterales bacterium]
MEGIVSAWGRILGGYRPSLSIEITRECPLRCPGCYAYGDEHLGGEITLRQVRDFKGQELIDKLLALVDHHKPLHVSIVGGEPLVRYRELNTILPELSKRNIYVQLVTSAVRESRRSGRRSRSSTSRCRSTGCNPSTTRAGHRLPTSASRSTSSVTRSWCTAR